jgi:hypothetical protein
MNYLDFLFSQLNKDSLKTYVIINGTSMYIRKYKTMAMAKQFAQNYLDNSIEIIIREVISLNVTDKHLFNLINNAPL